MNGEGDGPKSGDGPETPDHRRASGQVAVWNPEDTTSAYEAIVQRNPLHLKLFEEMRRILRERSIDRLVDIGGGTGLFVEKLREDGSDLRVSVVDESSAMIAKAQAKGMRGVETVCQPFGRYTIDRTHDEEHIAVISTYLLHNFDPHVRDWFFSWLQQNINEGEVFLLGDTVCEDPITNMVARERKAHKFLEAVGVVHWMNDDAIPLAARLNIIDHTAHDRNTAPDLEEYVELAKKYGFKMEVRWQEGYLRIILFTKM